MDKLYLGPVPADEPCAQVGTENFHARAKVECLAYKNQLLRMFGPPPGDARFAIASCPHDFGTYYEVVIIFNPNSKEETDFAYKVENNTPESWDDQARLDLTNN